METIYQYMKLSTIWKRTQNPNFYAKSSKITNGFCTSKSRYQFRKFLNEIKQIVSSLYQSKEITKKVYNNITKSI